MIESPQTTKQLIDYTLDLLTPGEKQQLRQQMQTDPTLLPKLRQERQIERLVRQTVQQASQIENSHLTRMMPPVTTQQSSLQSVGLVRQLVLAALLFLLLLGGWQWLNDNQPALWPASPTIVAATATMTYTPAATETEPAQQANPTETAVTTQAEPRAIFSPAPLATPVATMVQNTH